MVKEVLIVLLLTEVNRIKSLSVLVPWNFFCGLLGIKAGFSQKMSEEQYF